MKERSKLMKPIITIGIIAIVAIIMLVVYIQFKPKGVAGSKEIVIEVVIPDEETKEYTIHTDAEFLRQALDEKQLVAGSEGSYGFFITEVNGRAANDANKEWWNLTKDGQYVETGVDMTPIMDGDHFELTLTIGY